MKFWINYN